MPKESARYLEEFLSTVRTSGLYAIFQLKDVSYMPTSSAHENLGKRMIQKASGLDEKSYKALTECLGNEPRIKFTRLAHCNANGIFVYMMNAYGSKQGFLHINELTPDTEIRKFLDVSMISPQALFPKMHKVNEARVDSSRADFYTQDEEGSEWSIHCVPETLSTL